MKRIECEHCGQMVHPQGMHSHMRKHKGEQDAVQEVEEAKPTIPKWRRQTPVFGPGQAGIRIPRAKLDRGWK